MIKTLNEIRKVLHDNNIEYLVVKQDNELVKINVIVKREKDD